MTNVCSAVGFRVYDLDLPQGSTTLYAATDKGLLLCDLQSGAVGWVNSTNGLPRDIVRSIYTDSSRSRVYLAVTPGLSVYFENNGTMINLNTTHGLPSPIINSIDSTPSGDPVFLAASANGGAQCWGWPRGSVDTDLGQQEGRAPPLLSDRSKLEKAV